MAILSKTTEMIIETLFSLKDQDNVRKILSKQYDKNLPFLKAADESTWERFYFAMLKLSRGDLEELNRAVKLANEDLRDLLMAAGFGYDVKAHEKWAQTLLNIE